MVDPGGKARSERRGSPVRPRGRERGLYEELFEFAPIAYLVTDRDHRITQVNRAALALLAPSGESCVGEPLSVFLPLAERRVFQLQLNEAARGDPFTGWTLHLQPAGGAPMPVSAAVGRILDDQGRVAGHRWILRDLSGEKAMQAEIGRFEQMIAESSDLMAFVDREFVVRAVNGAYAAVFGARPGDVIGRPVAEVVGAETFRDYLGPHLEAGLAGESPHTERWYVSPSGEHLYLDVRYAPHRGADGTITGVIIDARDRTELRRLEEENDRRRADLAHVARLSTLGELASGLAHELNQPLSAIASYCAGARRLVQRGNASPELLVGTLDSCAAQAQRAGDIIRRMRTLVRRDHGARVPVDMNAVVCDVVSLLEGEGRRKNVEVTIDVAEHLPAVRVDRVQIEQVVLNLVLNAMEAIDEAGSPQRLVEVRTRGLDGDAVEVQVADSGPGLSGEATEVLFTPFYTTKAEGMGIGLSICRSIVDAHGGTLNAENVPGSGALMRLRLPGGTGEAVR